jgi:hypothetical protein
MLLSDLSDLKRSEDSFWLSQNVLLFAFHPGPLTLSFASPGNGTLPTSLLSAPFIRVHR